MTQLLFIEDAYIKEARATVVSVDETGAIRLDETLFYALGGGQPGDLGWLEWNGNRAAILECHKGEDGLPSLRLADDHQPPQAGTIVRQVLDWDRRYQHMKMHTALHLLSVVIPLPVNGGAIAAEKGRLDFDMPEPVDKVAVQEQLNALIAQDLVVTQSWITDDELAANPGLVKTMSVKPPTGSGKVRLVAIGSEGGQVDLQPCGGTHVARTSEIGPMIVRKVEKKGRQNRRVSIIFDNGDG